MDHEMNASTFAAIVVASTLSDLYSALVAGIAAGTELEFVIMVIAVSCVKLFIRSQFHTTYEPEA